MKYGIAVVYFGIFCTLLAKFGRLTRPALGLGVGMLVLLCLFALVNERSGLIGEKVASFVSYRMYSEGTFSLTFTVQYLLAFIPFSLLDYRHTAHGINIALQAFVFLLGAQYIFRVRPDWRLAVFLLYPSYFHYAIFGLRDPLISLSTVLLVIGILHLGVKQFSLLCAVLAIACVGVRPEFSMIILGICFIRLFIEADTRNRVYLLIAGLVGAWVALLAMPIAFGTRGEGSIAGNIERMNEFARLRYMRRLDGGGSGSHILGGSLYDYGFLLRYPIQVVASFIAPLPFEIRGKLDMIAFVESLLFTGTVAVALWRARCSRTSMILVCCGLFYMLLQALFAANYGNILRMRYPAFVFFLAACVVHVDQRDADSDETDTADADGRLSKAS